MCPTQFRAPLSSQTPRGLHPGTHQRGGAADLLAGGIVLGAVARALELVLGLAAAQEASGAHQQQLACTRHGVCSLRAFMPLYQAYTLRLLPGGYGCQEAAPLEQLPAPSMQVTRLHSMLASIQVQANHASTSPAWCVYWSSRLLDVRHTAELWWGAAAILRLQQQPRQQRGHVGSRRS
jgi:hypothetical protein